MDLVALTEKARAFLKSLNRRPEEASKEPPVPEPPGDPDRLDPRVEDASPTTADVEQAKEDTPDPEGEGTTDLTPKEDQEGASTEDFDAFGNHDLESREVQKALPPVGHPEPGELPKNFDPEDLVAELVRQMGDMQAVVRDLVAQMETFQRGQASAGRELKKAIESGQELREALARLHETAPPAAAPKAITKALSGGEGAVAPLLTRAELMALAGSGQLSPFEVACLNSHLHSPVPEENRS